MLSPSQIERLRAPFPPEALSSDTSRGFELTSIKAAYVIERLNEVFGPCGAGWRYAHSPLELLHTDNGRVEVVTEVALQYRCQVSDEWPGCTPVVWDARANGWTFRKDASAGWSEPVFACGGKGLGRGGVPLTDARKSAVTDGLTKAASMIGVGHEVFKGLVRLSDSHGDGDNGYRRVPGNGRADKPHADQGSRSPAPDPEGEKTARPDATAFWTLYNSQGKAAGVPIEVARKLTGQGDWPTACAELHNLIGATSR